MARIVRHPLAPEVVAEDVSKAGVRSDVRVVDDSPHIVVHELPTERVAVAQGAQGGQHGIATRGPHHLRPDGQPRLLAGFLLPSRRCHVGPGFSRGSAALRMKLVAPDDTSIPPGRYRCVCTAVKCGVGVVCVRLPSGAVSERRNHGLQESTGVLCSTSCHFLID